MATKTGIRNWSIVAVVFVALIYFLVTTGKEHTVFLDNRGGEAGIKYSIDGENYQDLGTKKVQKFVQGSSHTLYLKKANGEKLEQDFSLSFGENEAEINVKEMMAQSKK